MGFCFIVVVDGLTIVIVMRLIATQDFDSALFAVILELSASHPLNEALTIPDQNLSVRRADNVG